MTAKRKKVDKSGSRLTWQRDPKGYRFLHEPEMDGSGVCQWLEVMACQGPPEKPQYIPMPALERYLPLEPLGKRTLWREFADTDAEDKAAVLKLAGRFGLLTDGRAYFFETRVWGEDWKFWEETLHRLRELGALFDAVREKREEWLEQHFKFEFERNPSGGVTKVKGVFTFNPPDLKKPYENKEYGVYSIKRINPPLENIWEWALSIVQNGVNKQLEEHVTLRLLFEDIDPRARVKDADTLEQQAPHRETSLYMYPKNLLGAVWLDFAEEIQTRPEMRKCLNCTHLFKPTDTRDKVCSRKCYRELNSKPTGRPRGRPRKADRIPNCIPEPKDPQES